MTDNSTAPDSNATPPGKYYWFFIIYMAALSAFGSFVNDMYIPSLPEMCRHFHASPLISRRRMMGTRPDFRSNNDSGIKAESGG